MIKGIDVSKWEPKINWSLVMQDGYRFAFIKVSQDVYPDKRFQEHWAGAKAAGMPRGAYHYIDVESAPEKQAKFFYDSLQGDYGELPFVVDIEGFTSGKYYGSEMWYRYITELNRLSGNYPLMIYTAYYYWKDNVSNPPAVQDVSYFARYPLWIANYEVTEPAVPYPWKDWTFWQFSESGLVNGVYDTLGRLTECDLDYFYGSEEEFQKLLGAMPSGTGGTVSNTYYKATGNITIRQGPATSYPPVTSGELYVLVGDIVETTQPMQNGFVKISNLYRNNISLPIVPEAWCGSAYLQLTSYTPPAPPSNDCGNDDVKIYVNDVLQVHIVGKIQ